jgi:hypothetical protein
MANRGRLFVQQDDRVYKWLSEEQRKSRRSIADAMAVLRKEADFGEHDCAKILVSRFALPSGELVGMVVIQFNGQWEDSTYCVTLPTACRFKGLREGSTRYDQLDIMRLNKATTNATGTVVLADGTILGAVKVIPARMPLEPSELDRKIVLERRLPPNLLIGRKTRTTMTATDVDCSPRVAKPSQRRSARPEAFRHFSVSRVGRIASTSNTTESANNVAVIGRSMKIQ